MPRKPPAAVGTPELYPHCLSSKRNKDSLRLYANSCTTLGYGVGKLYTFKWIPKSRK
jgi:hypothetical protein